ITPSSSYHPSLPHLKDIDQQHGSAPEDHRKNSLPKISNITNPHSRHQPLPPLSLSSSLSVAASGARPAAVVVTASSDGAAIGAAAGSASPPPPSQQSCQQYAPLKSYAHSQVAAEVSASRRNSVIAITNPTNKDPSLSPVIQTCQTLKPSSAASGGDSDSQTTIARLTQENQELSDRVSRLETRLSELLPYKDKVLQLEERVRELRNVKSLLKSLVMESGGESDPVRTPPQLPPPDQEVSSARGSGGPIHDHRP
ncbi:hypothetical protein EV182_007227, partial [Spiromyces aspiralis]